MAFDKDELIQLKELFSSQESKFCSMISDELNQLEVVIRKQIAILHVNQEGSFRPVNSLSARWIIRKEIENLEKRIIKLEKNIAKIQK